MRSHKLKTHLNYKCVRRDSKYILIIDASTQTTQGTSPLYKHVHADIYRPDCCCPHRHNTSRSLLRPHRHNTSCRSQMVIWPTSVTISYWLFLLPMEVAAHAVCACGGEEMTKTLYARFMKKVWILKTSKHLRAVFWENQITKYPQEISWTSKKITETDK